jgi:tripartite-type tricarboxylate transporter receptor subunit TctC
MDRRTFLTAGALAFAGANAVAQAAYPQKPVRLIVQFPPGGGTVSRLVADKLGGAGFTIVVDNRAGAAGNIGLDAVAKAAPDGYTIGMGQASNLAINISLYAKMPYDPLKDLVPIVQVSAQPVVLVVRTDSPFRTLSEFVVAPKAKPRAYGVAQAGNGTVGHLAGELLARQAGIQLLQVPYKGAGQAMTDLLGGQVPLYFGSSGSVMAQLSAAKVRALCVTSSKRLPAFASVPTVAEQGYPGFDATTWLGLVGPAGMPREAIARINTDVVALLARKDVQEQLAGDGSLVVTGSSAQFAEFIRAEHAKWGALIREAQIKLE